MKESKGDAIRRVLREHPNFTNREVRMLLLNDRVEVSDGYISVLRGPRKVRENPFEEFSDNLVDVKNFVQMNGGIEYARELVKDVEDLLEDLVDVDKALDVLEKVYGHVERIQSNGHD